MIQPARPQPSILPRLLLPYLASRVLIVAVAGLSLLIIRQPPGFAPPHALRDWFVHWDAGWYLDLVRHGYSFHGPGKPTNVAFLPLYAWVVRLVSFGGRIDPKLAAYAVSLAGLWCACVLLYRFTAREAGDADVGFWAVEFMLFSPVSLFFSAPFSEALFLPLIIATIGFARERRWIVAGTCGMLAALSRSVGILLVVPLLWEWVAWIRTAPRTASTRLTVLAALLPLAGTGIYVAIIAFEFRDPLAYFHAQAEWGRHLTWFWGAFAKHSFWSLPPFYRVWFAAAFFGSFLLLLGGVLLRLPAVYAVLGISFGIFYVSASGVEALPRYFSVVFPLYVSAAVVAKRVPALRATLLATSAALLALSTILFVNGYWFT